VLTCAFFQDCCRGIDFELGHQLVKLSAALIVTWIRRIAAEAIFPVRPDAQWYSRVLEPRETRYVTELVTTGRLCKAIVWRTLLELLKVQVQQPRKGIFGWNCGTTFHVNYLILFTYKCLIHIIIVVILCLVKNPFKMYDLLITLFIMLICCTYL